MYWLCLHVVMVTRDALWCGVPIIYSPLFSLNLYIYNNIPSMDTYDGQLTGNEIFLLSKMLHLLPCIWITVHIVNML